MPSHRRPGSTLLGRLIQTLRSLPRWLGLDAAQQVGTLVPIPIRADRPDRLAARRDRHLGG